METRVCKTCGQEKTVDNFRKLGRYGRAKLYWNSYCNPCESLRNVEYRKQHPEWAKKQLSISYLKWKMRITGGKCNICGENRTLDVAHIIPKLENRKTRRLEPADNLLGLCPTHHRLFDEDKLTDEEFSKIEEKVRKAGEIYA